MKLEKESTPKLLTEVLLQARLIFLIFLILCIIVFGVLFLLLSPSFSMERSVRIGFIKKEKV
jgi:uncharacterized protein involved in exopolysaccharide biosynthesis